MNILVIDPEYAYFKSIRTSIGANFDDVTVWHVESVKGGVAEFQKQITAAMEEAAKEKPAAPVRAAPVRKFEPIDHIDLTISIERETAGVKSIVSSSDLGFLGFETARFTKEPLFWKTLVDIEDRQRFQKFLHEAKRSARREEEFLLRDESQRLYKATLTVEPDMASDDPEADCLRLNISCQFQSIQSEGGAALGARSQKSIDAVIVAWESLGDDAPSKIKTFFSEVQKNNGVTPFLKLVSAYDQADLSMKTILSCDVSDVFFKPYDELLFLQKILIQNVGMTIRGEGSFLYTARRPFALELAGEYAITGLSEAGFEVKSRAPIVQFKKMKMYSDLFGAAGRQGLHALCYMTEPNPEETHLISKFSFFGISAAQLKHIRDVLTPHRKNIPIDGERKSNFKQIRPFSDDVKQRARRILLVDLDLDTAGAVEQLMERNMETYQFNIFRSMGSLLQALGAVHDINHGLNQAAANLTEWKTIPLMASIELEPVEPRPVFLFDPSTHVFVNFKDLPAPETTLASYNLASLVMGDWMKPIFTDDKERVEELFNYAAGGEKASVNVRLVDVDGGVYLARVSAGLDTVAGRELIALDFEDITARAIEERRTPSASEDDAIEVSETVAVIVDLNFIRQHPDESLEKLAAALQNATGREQTPIFLMAKDAEINHLIKRYRLPIRDVLSKPIDRHYFLRKVRPAVLQALGEDDQSEPFVALNGWLDIARPIVAEGIGEYGVEFSHATRVPEGAWGYFYHPALINEEGRGLLGRCIRTMTLDGKFKMTFLFLGIREEMLKKIRLFIKRFNLSDPPSSDLER